MSLTPPAPDTGIAQPPARPNERFRFVTQPSGQQQAAKKWLTVMICVDAVLALALIAVFALPHPPMSLWIVVGAGVLASLVFLMLWLSAQKVRQWSGDDLIDLLVLEEGFVTQGGFEVSWQEVSKIEAVKFAPKTPRRMSAAQAVGHAAGSALADFDGAKTTVNIHLFDAKAALARTTTKRQKLAIIDEIGRKEGHVLTQLGFRPAQEINALLQHLQQACEQRNKPFVFRESANGF
ncbi:MAG TPA: hypothetical protein VHG10_13520 [Glycomyces sp.]|nr:hypothetical protein [Glycomyces sp.]